MHKIVMVHGMNSSHRSFGYLSATLKEHHPVLVNYSSKIPLRSAIDQVLRQIPKSDEIVLIGHSLGGIISTIIASEIHERVHKLVTIATPHGGSTAARLLQWLPGSFNMFSDLTPESATIKKCTSLKLNIPTLNIVSTGGSLPVLAEPNDGIISVYSQKQLKFGKKIEINANHFEVLQDPRTASAINKFIFKGENEDHIEQG